MPAKDPDQVCSSVLFSQKTFLIPAKAHVQVCSFAFFGTKLSYTLKVKDSSLLAEIAFSMKGVNFLLPKHFSKVTQHTHRHDSSSKCSIFSLSLSQQQHSISTAQPFLLSTFWVKLCFKLLMTTMLSVLARIPSSRLRPTDYDVPTIHCCLTK